MVLYTVRRVVKWESDATLAVTTRKSVAKRLAQAAKGNEEYDEVPMLPLRAYPHVYLLQSRQCEDTRIVVNRIHSDELFKPCSTFFPSESANG